MHFDNEMTQIDRFEIKNPSQNYINKSIIFPSCNSTRSLLIYKNKHKLLFNSVLKSYILTPKL